MAATILITGTTGLIGFHTLLAALAAGHHVRYTVRSEEKAHEVSSNPAVQRLSPGNRISSVTIPDFTVAGAFDEALKGVTHVIHAGSPVPAPFYDPTTQVFQPTVKMASNLLSSALRAPSVQRIVITSSIVMNFGLVPNSEIVCASTRVPLPSPLPAAFDNVFEAYVMGKLVESHETDEFVRTRNPHFAVARVVPGYVFGRNELMLDADMMRSRNSSNNFLMMAMLGAEPPFPALDGFVHIDDLAEIHLRVALLEPRAIGPRDFGIATKVDYDSIFAAVERAFPKAVAAGVFKKGRLPAMPVKYDSSDVEQLLGRPLKSFESAVVDVAGQYLETLGVEKA
ncbi:putative cinnamoyl-CoA reductase [Xylariomycetidae sp. FL2044]|nr:putative cinnamoyl-CoA reductase [Xylariomycetidae sp. FL2044]